MLLKVRRFSDCVTVCLYTVCFSVLHTLTALGKVRLANCSKTSLRRTIAYTTFTFPAQEREKGMKEGAI